MAHVVAYSGDAAMASLGVRVSADGAWRAHDVELHVRRRALSWGQPADLVTGLRPSSSGGEMTLCATDHIHQGIAFEFSVQRAGADDLRLRASTAAETVAWVRLLREAGGRFSFSN